MTLSTDFAAANYTIHNDDGTDVDIIIRRLPFHIGLLKDDTSDLQLEIAVAYQGTDQVIPTDPAPGENIDAVWETYGIDVGLLYELNITKNLFFTPSLRLGVTRMKNSADYNGTLTNILKDSFDNILFNWTTNTTVLNVGLGLKYRWTLLDRSSSVSADYYHINVESFNESSAAVNFNENANMITVKGDMIFPTDYTVHGDRIDLVLLLGSTSFVGENKDTLGYTTSYQVGIGSELPLKINQKKRGYLRLSAHVLWAENMNGWLLTLGYSPE
jgi:hypothetical protein